MFFAHLTAKAIFAAVAIALAFFGVGFLGLAIGIALTSFLGAAGSYALVGIVFLIPPLVWGVVEYGNQRKPKPEAESGQARFVRSLLAAVAKETPWTAIISAGLVGIVEALANQRKSRK